MLRLLKALCLPILATASAAFAATTTDPLEAGDIVVGFYTDSGTGATQNLIVNLGSYTRLEANDGATLAFDAGIVADLAATYGPDWNSRTDLFWTVAGTLYATSVNGLTRNTVFAASPRAAADDAPVPIASGSDSTLAAVRLHIQAIGITYNVYDTTANSAVAVLVEGGNPDSFQARQQTSNAPQFGPANANPVAGARVSDFYGLVPTSGGVAPTGLSADATGRVWTRGVNYLGYFTLTASGLSFTASGSAAPSAPVFVTQPASQTVLIGANATFTASVTGSPAPKFQWYKGSVPLVGQTTATLSLSNVQAADAGLYRLLASNDSAPEGVFSDTVTLKVNAIPVFTTQPVSRTVLTGANVAFSAEVSGSPAPHLQWLKGSTPLDGQTSATLTLSNVRPSDSGQYTLRASNEAAVAGVLSDTVTLTVSDPAAPSFTTQPVSKTANAGASVSFTAAVSGTPAPALQWYKGDALLEGQTSATLTFAHVQLSDAGDYTLRAANGIGAGEVVSDTVTLTVNALSAPVFSVQPVSQTVVSGGNVSFSAVVSGNPAPALQWYKGDVALEGQTSATLTLADVRLSAAGDYTLIATNSSAPNGIASSTVSLAVHTLPVFVTPPASVTVDQGQDVNFTATVSGVPVPTLQWYKGDVALDGQTSATLSLADVRTSDAGEYKVVATNAAAPGGVASGIATLTVHVPVSAPAFTSSPASQTVHYGAPLTLSCSTTGNPAPTFVWRKGKTVVAGQNSDTLVIAFAKLGDAGVYTVTAFNDSARAGVVSAAATVKVVVPAPAALADPGTLRTGSQVAWDLSGARPIPAGLVFKASGLPAGLKLDSATGKISGVITAKAGAVQVSTWAQVGATKSAVNRLSLTIGDFPAALAGSCEALLFAPDSSLPAAKASIAVAANGTFTGTLLADETKAFALKGRFALAADNTSASVQLSLARSGRTPCLLTLALAADPVFNARLTGDGATLDSRDDGVRLLSAAPAGAVSAYTLLLADPENLGTVDALPLGFGYATASINAKGVLTLSGKTADDVKLTASLPLGADSAYRVFAKPYALAGGFVAGGLPLTARTAPATGWHVAPEAGSDLYWRKPDTSAATANYADGFGPLGLEARLEPWTKPTALLPLPTLLRLSSESTVAVSFAGAGLFDGDSLLHGLPTTLTVSATNTLVVADSTNATLFSGKIVPATGAVSGSFTLPATPPLAARKIAFNGVLLQPATADGAELIGGGFFLVPANSSGGPVSSGAIKFAQP